MHGDLQPLTPTRLDADDKIRFPAAWGEYTPIGFGIEFGDGAFNSEARLSRNSVLAMSFCPPHLRCQFWQLRRLLHC